MLKVVLVLLAGIGMAQGVVDKPKVLTKKDWGGKDASLRMKEHKITRITIHHAGVKQNRERDFPTKLRNLQTWCQREDKLASGKVKPAWPDIPYHYYISWKGEMAECRDWRFVGDTNTEYDPTGHLLVCLEGEFDTETPAKEQLDALTKIVVWLAKEHKVSPEMIGAHCDFAKSACPGKKIIEQMPAIRDAVAKAQR